MVVNTISIGALELSGWAGNVLLFTIYFVRMITAIVLAIASICVPNAFEVLARKFFWRASLVFGVTEFSFIRAISAIVVMIACPSLED